MTMPYVIWILSETEQILSRETSFYQFSNMASSGLKKMLISIILYTCVSVNMCLINFDLMADVMPS